MLIDTLQRELQGIEARYVGKRFADMPPHVRECWSELFERYEQELFAWLDEEDE